MIILRPATPADTTALATLARTSFCDKFGHLYKEDDLNAFLHQTYHEDVVAAEIADPRYIHQLAFDGDAMVGYCKMAYPSGYHSHSDAADPIGLGQLYTDGARTGQGIGAALMDWALELAKARGHDAIQLSVWSENYGAQKFYQRYGFAKIADIYFMVGTHRDDEFLYELRL